MTLKELGFVYQMGHDGRACSAPENHVSRLLVFDICGPIPLCLKYCACGKFARGMEGHWQQIRYWMASFTVAASGSLCDVPSPFCEQEDYRVES
jgi:hypothetical protein